MHAKKNELSFDLACHRGSVASLVETKMAGIPQGGYSIPRGTRSLAQLIEEYGHIWLSEERGRRMLKAFLDLTASDDSAGLMDVAEDILDNPELVYHHYNCFQIRKKSGGMRDIEAPEKPLKTIQRQVLDHWWYAKRRPAPFVHGFVPKRGTLTNAGSHVADGLFGNSKILVKSDFSDFFKSITRGGVMNALLDGLGNWYVKGGAPRKPPRILVKILTRLEPKQTEACGLTEESAARGISFGMPGADWLALSEVCLDHVMLRLCCLDERLCQGSPCSPALANVFLRRFHNLVVSSLAAEFGEDRFTYTAYADDTCTTLLDDEDSDESVSKTLGILMKHMYSYPDISVNQEKTGVFRHGRSQKVTGITITDKLSISKKDRDKVRARLHNAATGREPLTDEEKMRIIGQRAWMRGVDAAGWDSRCEKEFQEVIGNVRR